MIFRIREFPFFFRSAIMIYYNNNFREILEFANLSSSRNSQKLKSREYYLIYSIYTRLDNLHLSEAVVAYLQFLA